MNTDDKIMLPEQFRKYFWEYKGVALNMRQDAVLVTEPILNFGNYESMHWLLGNVTIDFLKQTALSSKKLDKKTVNYWKLILLESNVYTDTTPANK